MTSAKSSRIRLGDEIRLSGPLERYRMERVRQLAEAFLLAKPFRNKEPNHHLIADFSELRSTFLVIPKVLY